MNWFRENRPSWMNIQEVSKEPHKCKMCPTMLHPYLGPYCSYACLQASKEGWDTKEE